MKLAAVTGIGGDLVTHPCHQKPHVMSHDDGNVDQKNVNRLNIPVQKLSKANVNNQKLYQGNVNNSINANRISSKRGEIERGFIVMCVNISKWRMRDLKFEWVVLQPVTVEKNVKRRGGQLNNERKINFYKTGICNISLTPSKRDKVVWLIGKKSDVNYKMNDIETKFLLDKGAPASVILKNWLRSNLSDITMNKIKGLLDRCDKLKIQCGNQIELPFLE